MKINKKMLTILIMGGTLFLAGCSRVNISSEINDSTSSNDIVENRLDSNIKYSQEELIAKYKELLPDIKQIFDDYKIDYNKYEDIKPELKKQFEEMLSEGDESLKDMMSNFEDIKWDSSDGIVSSMNSNNESDILTAQLYIYYDLKDKNSIYFNSMMNVDLDDARENGFDIKGTFFEAVTEAINSKNNSAKIDYEKINKDINDTFKESAYSNSPKVYNYENLEITVLISPAMSYSVRIK